jgi:hypothetical protein
MYLVSIQPTNPNSQNARLREEKEQLRIRVWNRVASLFDEQFADVIESVFDEPMAPAGSPLSRIARSRMEKK